MAYGFVAIVHIVAILFTMIEIGLTAYLVSVYDEPYHSDNSPHTLNFMLFSAVWSVCVLAYIGLAPLYYTRVFHRLVSLALEWITVVFWFAGSIALAAYVGGPHHCHTGFCRSIEAAIAFGFFLWVLFCVLVVVDTTEALRARRHAKPDLPTPL